MTTLEIQQYYANLLILQYLQKPKAYAMVASTALPILIPDSNVQSLAFTPAPTSGNFTLVYNGVATASIAWNDSIGTIQARLSAILTSPLSVVVSGSISSGLTFTFSNYTDAVQLLSIGTNTLGSIASFSPIGVQLPFEIQDGFNITSAPGAVGVQLDTIGKYVGVSRTGYGFNGPIDLNDADFLTLIQMGIVRNKSGSSLATIQSLLNQFFPNEIFVFDYTNMNMSYLISTSIGSQDLIDLFVTEGLLPRPMGVGLSVIAAPIINMFFGFGSYISGPSPNVTPFNSYSNYQTSWLWLSYQNAIPTT